MSGHFLALQLAANFWQSQIGRGAEIYVVTGWHVSRASAQRLLKKDLTRSPVTADDAAAVAKMSDLQPSTSPGNLLFCVMRGEFTFAVEYGAKCKGFCALGGAVVISLTQVA